METVIGQEGVDLVGDRFDQPPEEVARHAQLAFTMQLDEGELAGPVDGTNMQSLRVSSYRLRLSAHGIGLTFGPVAFITYASAGKG